MNDEEFANEIIGWQCLVGIMLVLFVTGIIHTIASQF